MILCVAGNPSVDKLFEVDRVRVGEIHRPDGFIALPGGKGIHVAQVAHRLGAEAVVTGILGGHAGRWIDGHLAAGGVDGRFVWDNAETRSSLSVADRSTGLLTEFYEAGPEVSADDWDGVVELVEAGLAEASWLVLAGSLLPGVPMDAYLRLIELARERGVPSAVDARGPTLVTALTARPKLVKINSHEAAELLGQPVDGVDAAVDAARSIWDQLGGMGHAAAVTVRAGAGLMDPDGTAWLGRVDANGRYPVGSGDSFLAGLVVAAERADPWPDAMRLALGAAAANSEIPGAAVLDPERTQELAATATCERLSSES